MSGMDVPSITNPLSLTNEPERLHRLAELGEALWTENEGDALDVFRAELSFLRSLTPGGSDDNVLRLLARCGQIFWMVGEPRLGLDLAEPFLPAEMAQPPSVMVSESANLKLPNMVAVDPSVFRGSLGNLSDSTVPRELLLACCLDGAGTNAYACTKYADAAQLHATALSIAEGFKKSLNTDPRDSEDVGRRSGQGDRQLAFAFGGSGLRHAATLVCVRALDGLGRVCRESGEYARSLALHSMAAQAAVPLCTLEGHPVYFRPEASVANAISNAGVAAYRLGRLELSQQFHEEAHRLRVLMGDLRGISSSVGNLALLKSDPAEALSLYTDALVLRKRLNDTWGVAGAHRALATQLIRRGDVGDIIAARAHLGTALLLFAQVDDKLGIAESLESLGLLCLASRGDADAAVLDTHEHAAMLLGAAVGVRMKCGAAVDVVVASCPASGAGLRETHAEAWERGASMTVVQAIELGRA